MSTVASLQTAAVRGTGRAAAVALLAWLVVVITLGALGAFIGPPGRPPLAIALGVLVPLAVFFTALWLSVSFRSYVLDADLRILTAVQAWRFAGFGFIALTVYRVLPGGFAWPAGLGDMAIGLTAPWVMYMLNRRPDFATSKAFIAWNLFGILDLVVAVGSGALHAMLATGATGEISTMPMAELPLLLIPVYLVPLFLMLHVAALLQVRTRTKA